MTDEELARDLVIKYINSSCTRDELSALFDLLEKNSISLSEWDAVMLEQWENGPL